MSRVDFQIGFEMTGQGSTNVDSTGKGENL